VARSRPNANREKRTTLTALPAPAVVGVERESASITDLPTIEGADCGDRPLDAAETHIRQSVQFGIDGAAVSAMKTRIGEQRTLQGWLDTSNWPVIKGWVWDPSNAGERIPLELVEGTTQLATTVASDYRSDLAGAGVGDGRHAFSIELMPVVPSDIPHTLHLRCAVSGAPVPGSPIFLKPLSDAHEVKLFRWRIDEITDRFVRGWIKRTGSLTHCVVTLKEKGKVLVRDTACQFRKDVLSEGIGDGCYGFTLPMPRSLLDGKLHLLEIVEEETGFSLTEEPARWRSTAQTAQAALPDIPGEILNPYNHLPDKAFWRLSVSSKNMLDITELWNPKFDIRRTQPIATFGSCFSQHIGVALKAHGYRWLIAEQPPYGLREENAKLFGYNTYSARTGSIYTTSLLKQWTEWALGKSAPSNEVWEKDDRFYDPFRPTIEPNGFDSETEMRASRDQAIASFRNCVERADFLFFTLGLTETWITREGGYEYPMCPGTAGGIFDARKHLFRNQQFQEIALNLTSTTEMMRLINKDLRFLLAVSPMPLVATKSGNHVLVATMESKSILRAVAGELATNLSYIDYLPFYEIVNSPVFKGVFYEPNQRNINHHGIKFLMNAFVTCLSRKYGEAHVATTHNLSESQKYSACDVELLDAFGGRVDQSLHNRK
jgi:hypothetical protein